MRVLIAAAVLASAVLAGCATPSLNLDYSTAINSDKVAKVKVGVSTREDLNELFGEPEMKVPTPDGICYFYKDLNLNSFWALFSDDWVLREYEWSD